MTRQSTLSAPTQLGDDVFGAAEKLFRATWKRGELVRLLGVGVSGLSAGVQFGLFDEGVRDEKLQLARTLDQLKEQYGTDVVKRASLTRKKKS